jgi:putative ABC transport system permease protein
MNLFSAIRVALAALMVNKGRSALTSLGIVIGIGAVIAMMAAGTGARQKLDERLDSVGKNLILIRPGGRTSTGLITQVVPLTTEDANVIREDPELKRLLVGVSESQHLQTIVSTNTGNHHTTVTGGRPAIFNIRNWKLAHGRFYNEDDLKKANPVCLIGETVRKKLFPNLPNPVGQRLRVERLYLEVIGLLEAKGRSPTGDDQDDQVFVPISTVQDKIAYGKQIGIIVAAARSQEYTERVEQRMRILLRQTHRLRGDMEDDFQVSSVQELASLALIVTRVLNILIVIIASISLVVGGIGIMNIMLVSVTERTREIGIRLAVGATASDVRNQFLIEAVVLSLVGGVIGITLGVVAAIGLAHVANWPIYVSPMSVALAFGVSAFVGVCFGYFPAVKASRLDPIEALRYE